MTEPRTEAGRRLLERDRTSVISYAEIHDRVLAIEAEAASLDVERLALAVSRAVVEADRRYPSGYSMTGDLVPIIAAEYARLSFDD